MVFEIKGNEELGARLALRLPDREKELIRDEASLAGLGMSELVRARYFGRPIMASVDLNMIKQLRKVTGLLKHIHTSSDGAYSEQTANMLSEVKAFLVQIQRQSKDRDRHQN